MKIQGCFLPKLSKGNWPPTFIQSKIQENLLGKQQNSRKAINKAIINQGPVLTPEQQILMCKNFTGIQESSFPMRYFGVPIIVSRLTMIECRSLIEKILAKVHNWATRNISFAQRARLINSVVFGMFNYWVSIFLLPNKPTERITQIYRNYLWSGTEDFKKVLYISGQHICRTKAKGGLGIKEFTA
ncbi:hypothetical protein Cgig2_033067 [Carnegiea gigantea]|uniref:Reverse transcriptase n=1 Tax=Carnegiea gigantea TaxID=171969 RepID=A0A9Q1JHJ5_9CARY|nr:hypothetical protein Cgig2_033067 [Carnegiea gigantea]